MFLCSIGVGVLWFIVESSFVFVLQAFLSSIGLLEREKTFLPSFFPSGFGGALFSFLLFGLVRSLAILLKFYFSDVTFQSFVRYQRERTLHYSLIQVSEVSTPEVLDVFNSKIPYSGTVIQQMSMLINTTISAAMFFGFGLFLAPAELIMGIILLIVVFIPFSLINKKISIFGKEQSEELLRLSELLLTGLKNNFLLRVYNLLDGEVDRGQKSAQKYELIYKKYIFWSSVKTSFPQFAGAVVLTLICFVSFKYLETPALKVISFIYIFMRLAQNLSEGSGLLSNVRFNWPNFVTLFRWHEKFNQFINNSQSSEQYLSKKLEYIFRESKGISLKAVNLGFSFGDTLLFSGLNFEINTGEVLLLKGRSGSGKSTLLTLLLGLTKPTVGSVEVNECDAHKVRSLIAPHIGYVGPEPYLVRGTFRENLLYGNDRKNLSDDDLFEALRKSQILDLVMAKPKKLDEFIKEVAELSTGQKQRLAIGRALLRNPQLLILDEATANLDLNTERDIVDMLRSLSKEITTIIISHKDSFDAIATEKINLEEKK